METVTHLLSFRTFKQLQVNELSNGNWVTVPIFSVFWAVLAGALIAPATWAQQWVEDSFEDFADGRLDASGQNLYVSRDGTIRTIHRFDLNQDGHLDLIFNNTHDRRSFVPATLAEVSAERRVSQSALAVEGSRRVVLADLNRDGHLDAVFCPNASGVQNPRRFLTILWGGADGWPGQRSNGQLPVYGASTLAVADLDHDSWPDIVVLNGEAWLPGQPSGRIVRVFWGSQRGFLLTRRSDLGVPAALDLAAADFDQDGAADVAILTTDDKIQLLWAAKSRETAGLSSSNGIRLPDAPVRSLAVGDAEGDGRPDLVVSTAKNQVYLLSAQSERLWATPKAYEAFPASHVAIGDLDGDGAPELVLTDFALNRAGGGEAAGAGKQASAAVQILWNESGEWSASSASQLDVPYAAATAIGNLDNDGHADLAVAVHQSGKTFAANSLLFLGKGERQFERGWDGIRTEGASDVAIAPASERHAARAVFANSLGGTVGEAVPLQVYWGGPKQFDPQRQWKIPFRSGYEASAADLDADGQVDLVALQSGHAGAAFQDDPYLGANIFWGTPKGFDVEKRRTVLPENNLAGSNVADLNRDGYLDLVLGSFDPSDPLAIYYGSAEGFAKERRQAVPCEGRSGDPLIADFNRDDWLDIAVVSFTKDLVRIFWGSPGGFDAARQAGLDVPGPIALETADLNADGWLDLAVGSYHDPLSGHHDTGTLIFWGAANGFEHWNAQHLPGMTPVGLAIADFDGDSHLDLFSPHYHAELTRESLPSYLYWGSIDGFAPRRRTRLICDSAHDAMAGDFDRDGRLDLAVSCHTSDGDHSTVSKVFYNDGDRFRQPRVQALPTHGTHWMWRQDVGHIYDREWSQTYESSIFSWDTTASAGQLGSTAEVPKGTELGFSVRSAAKPEEIEKQTWRAVHGGRFSVRGADRVLQYRATLRSDNGDRYPALDRVSILLGP